ncbi:C-C chemokine receptor type 8-like [Triplophysa dalaica]|uniref:C-C chemokine receptor type 8-like n=1 Tax=Triplophysa dalaica TaxID=1582913 RepID=UPI0024DFEB42|nr:C-C chemokine receptor type 8-like [Triplophysa dalaica]
MNDSTAISTTPASSSNFTTSLALLLRSDMDIVVFGINILFGLPTHSYVIWLIIKGTGSGIASEFFNLNLSISETIYCLNCAVYVLSFAFPSLLPFCLFFVGLSIAGRPLFQCLICVERYLAVVHPVTFLNYKPLRYRASCCIVVWIMNLATCFFCRFLLCSPIFLQNTWLVSVQFIIFFSIQLFCCLAVLRALKQSGPGERGREREEENHMKRRAFPLILITTFSMVIMFVPYIVTGILTNLNQFVPVRLNDLVLVPEVK